MPFGLGIDSGAMWLAAGSTADVIRHYVGTTLITTTSSTGLAVTGGVNSTATNQIITANGVRNSIYSLQTANSEWGIGQLAGNNILFITNQTGSQDLGYAPQSIAITSAGNVGIGTTSPTDKLDVNGTVILRSNVSTSAVLGINRNTSTGAILDATKHAYQFVATAAGIDFQAYNTAGTSLGNAFSISGVNTTFGGAIAIGNTVNTVTATLPNRTITMVIGGTTYYIHAKTTND
jgi:hypothetical protein